MKAEEKWMKGNCLWVTIAVTKHHERKGVFGSHFDILVHH